MFAIFVKNSNGKNVAESFDDSGRNSKHHESVCCSRNDCFSQSLKDDISYQSSEDLDSNCNLKSKSGSRNSKDHYSDNGSRFRACINLEYPVVSDDRDQDTTAACLEGLVRTDGHGHRLVLLDENTVYWRGHRSASKESGRVKVLAGHRGGHYPAFARYVGAGMLDAAIVGPNRGRQPSATHILVAIRELDDGHGVLVLVAGELSARISYGIAATRARSQGIDVKLLAVGDDVVRHRPTFGGNCCRRHGAAGIVLLCKIAGAMSISGHNLAEIFNLCQRISVDRIATVNAMIDINCSYAGNDRTPEVDIRNITEHDESVLLLGTDTNGRNAMRTVRTTNTAEMVSAALKVLSTSGDDDDFRDIQRWQDADVVVMVNNFGGMSDGRFMVVVAEVATHLTAATGVRAVHRWYTGRMLSSAGDRDNGFSVTIMDVGVGPGAPRDCVAAAVNRPHTSSLLTLLDVPVATSGWTFAGRTLEVELPTEYVRRPRYEASPLSDDDDDNNLRSGPTVSEVHVPFVTDVLNHVCDRIVEAESRLNEFDAADDGDCGRNWRRGATALKNAMAAGRVNASNPADALREISRLMEAIVAGTSGSLLAVLFRSWSRAFREHPGHETADPAMWVDGLCRGVLAVKVYGMCQPGQRTMLDALVPAVRGMSIVLRESKNPVHLLSRAVREAKTAVDMNDANFQPDAGTYGVKIVLEAVLEKYLELTIVDE